MFSFKINFGGLKSSSEIGLKDIQKLAKSGIITIDKTKNIVGKIKKYASFFSLFDKILSLFLTIFFIIKYSKYQN